LRQGVPMGLLDGKVVTGTIIPVDGGRRAAVA
jgi:hypothetical protein